VDSVGAKYYCLHALADGNQCIRIRENTSVEFSSTVLSTPSPYLHVYHEKTIDIECELDSFIK